MLYVRARTIKRFCMDSCLRPARLKYSASWMLSNRRSSTRESKRTIVVTMRGVGGGAACAACGDAGGAAAGGLRHSPGGGRTGDAKTGGAALSVELSSSELLSTFVGARSWPPNVGVLGVGVDCGGAGGARPISPCGAAEVADCEIQLLSALGTSCGGGPRLMGLAS